MKNLIIKLYLYLSCLFGKTKPTQSDVTINLLSIIEVGMMIPVTMAISGKLQVLCMNEEYVFCTYYPNDGFEGSQSLMIEIEDYKYAMQWDISDKNKPHSAPELK